MSVKRPIGRNNLDKALHRLFKEKPAQPKRVPSAYVMHPFSIKVSYLGKP